jgi:hypothetical protein
MQGAVNVAGRPSYTGRPREALFVTLAPNGRFAIGSGRLTIKPGPVPFVGSVVGDLGRILDLPDGAALLERADALGHATEIALPDRPTIPINGWTVPDDLQAATEAGAPCAPPDQEGGPPRGTGKGCGSTIFYNPSDWQTPGEPHAVPSWQVLMALLQQANLNAAGRNCFLAPVPEVVSAPAEAPDAPRFHCSATRVLNTLMFSYAIHNPGRQDIFLMDGWSAGAATLSHSHDRANVIANPNGDAVVGRFVAPWPMDRHVARVSVPLGRRVAAGTTLEGCIEIPEPLTEASPYFPDLPATQYAAAPIGGVEVRIGYWASDLKVLQAEPVAPDADIYAMAPAVAARSALYLSRRFPTRGLQLLKRPAACRAMAHA